MLRGPDRTIHARVGLAALTMVTAVWSGYFAWQRQAPPGTAAKSDRVAAAVARQQLHSAPLDAAALRQLAEASEQDLTLQRELYALSERVSRRDTASQVWLLEDAAARGDLAATLARYDVLLMTRSALHKPLFEVLGRALGEPAVRTGLAPYAARPWLPALIRHAVAEPGQAGAALAAAKVTGLLRSPEARRTLAAGLIAGLVADREMAAAAALADRVAGPGWRTFGFSAAALDELLGPLAWQLSSGAVAGGGEGRAADDLSVDTAPGQAVFAAQRTTLLPPGHYRLRYRIVAADAPGAGVIWQASCLGAPDRGRFVDARAAAVPGRVEVAFEIPTSCPAQHWALLAEGADGQIGGQLYLGEADLVPQ